MGSEKEIQKDSQLPLKEKSTLKMCIFPKYGPRTIRQRRNKRRLNQVILEHALSLQDYRTQIFSSVEKGEGFQTSLDPVKNRWGSLLTRAWTAGNWVQVATAPCVYVRACEHKCACAWVTVSTSGTVNVDHESWFCFLGSVACGLAGIEVWDFATAVPVTWGGNWACTAIVFISSWARALPAKRPCFSIWK